MNQMNQTQLAKLISQKLIELSQQPDNLKALAKNDNGSDPNLNMLMLTLPDAIAYGIITYHKSLHHLQ